jgi:hypothetical protein
LLSDCHLGRGEVVMLMLMASGGMIHIPSFADTRLLHRCLATATSLCERL